MVIGTESCARLSMRRVGGWLIQFPSERDGMRDKRIVRAKLFIFSVRISALFIS